MSKNFNVYTENGSVNIPYKKRFELFERAFVIHRKLEVFTKNEKPLFWYVSEYSTGVKIGPGYRTMKDAEKYSKEKLESIGPEKLEEAISHWYKKYGKLNE